MSVAASRRTAGSLVLAALLAGAACSRAADRAAPASGADTAAAEVAPLKLDLGPDSVRASVGSQVLMPARVVDARGRVVDSVARPVTFVVRDPTVGRMSLEPRYRLLYMLSTRRGRTWVVGTLVRGGVNLVDSVWVDATTVSVDGH